jgi:hypothetical protein
MSVITLASIEYSPPIVVAASFLVLAVATWVLWPRVDAPVRV